MRSICEGLLTGGQKEPAKEAERDRADFYENLSGNNINLE